MIHRNRQVNYILWKTTHRLNVEFSSAFSNMLLFLKAAALVVFASIVAV